AGDLTIPPGNRGTGSCRFGPGRSGRPTRCTWRLRLFVQDQTLAQARWASNGLPSILLRGFLHAESIAPCADGLNPKLKVLDGASELSNELHRFPMNAT